MFAPEQADWKALVHAAIAFCWAVEPDEVRLPLAHWLALGAGAAELLEPLLSLPQALSESAAAAAIAPAPTSRVRLLTSTVLLMVPPRAAASVAACVSREDARETGAQLREPA